MDATGYREKWCFQLCWKVAVMPEKLPKIMLGWEQEMLNARKCSAAQSCHADPLPYLRLRGKCMKVLHKNAQRKQSEKTKDKLLQFLFCQTTEMHSNQASLILPAVIKYEGIIIICI